jgi:hypothetical protein
MDSTLRLPQGLFGLTTLALLVSYALTWLIRRTVSGNQDSVVILASIAGFLVVGMFDSLLDVPRIATLLFLVLCIAVQRVGENPPGVREKHRRLDPIKGRNPALS